MKATSGTGSGVVNDVPASVFAAGTPCRTIRGLNPHNFYIFWPRSVYRHRPHYLVL